MNHKDLCFLGLIALAFVYLDARLEEAIAAPAPTRAPARPRMAATPATALGAELLFRAPVAARPAAPGCPRDPAHPIARRPDGAIWCRGCDEAYYPSTPDGLLAIA